MECPHLCESVKIDRDFIKNKKCELSRTGGDTTSGKIWRCLECSSIKENWMCLNCGTILCGRYENGHALKHSSDNLEHYVCLNTINCSIYCYKCDDYVINDTTLEDLRQEFKDDDALSDELVSVKSQQDAVSTSLNDSFWEDVSFGRRLRPRKRTTSTDSNDVIKRKTLRKVVGLRNLGNTCFMNSVLQSLNNIKEFSYYFSTLPSLESKKQNRVHHSRSLKENVNDAIVVEELRKIFTILSHGGNGSKAISPECLFLVIWKVVPQFRGHRQHDAHEFLRYMLDRLHNELQLLNDNNSTTTAAATNNTSNTMTNTTNNATIINSKTSNLINSSDTGSIMFKGRTSIVTNIFGGTLQSEVRCLFCGVESKKLDPFLDLSLDIPERFYKENDENNINEIPVCHITDCLSSFTEVEELAETELYYCGSCKCKQKSTKRFWIRRLPNVLCLHIKRFRWNNFFRTKIDLRITFPIKALDMSQFVLNNGPETRRSSAGNNIYDLAAVIVHHGNGSSCGHYTSFAINNGAWLHFDDHAVKEVSPSAVANCKPYILFYIRRDLNKNL